MAYSMRDTLGLYSHTLEKKFEREAREKRHRDEYKSQFEELKAANARRHAWLETRSSRTFSSAATSTSHTPFSVTPSASTADLNTNSYFSFDPTRSQSTNFAYSAIDPSRSGSTTSVSSSTSYSYSPYSYSQREPWEEQPPEYDVVTDTAERPSMAARTLSSESQTVRTRYGGGIEERRTTTTGRYIDG